MSFHVTICSARRQLETTAEEGEQILALLQRKGFYVPAACGGRGACGKCTVTVIKGDKKRRVLACRSRIDGDCSIITDEISGGAILADIRKIFRKPQEKKELAVALDLGTTTLAAEMVDLSDGSSRGVAAEWNAQAAYGADVITRAQFCAENPDGLQTLQHVIRKQTDELLGRMGTSRGEVKRLFVAGNTIMQHIYAGLDPVPIAKAPFTPQAYFIGDEPKEEGIAYAPCVAGYVGGDITAGLMASGLFERQERSLYLDIGTNGEMALGGADGFLCCAVASGPAFEGAGIRCGMAGTEGAVSHVRWEGEEPALEVIGGGAPRGLCGSGLIDLLALLTERRLISAYGLLLGPEEAPPGYERWLGEDENGNGVFYLTEDRSVYLSAGDVRQLQLAKAAVAAGIAVLLKRAGLRAGELDRVYLAGGFGSYMDAKSAAAIGMLPAELTDRTVLLGNASLAGARMALLDPAYRETLLAIQRSCRYLELSGDADFNREYPEQMLFYEEDEDEWN